MRSSLLLIMAIFACLGFNPSATACSTFCYRDGKHLLVGKNYDFYTGAGYILVNKRFLSKSAYPIPGEPPIAWVSKYGSITFNQFGREFPVGGINEKGLVVEVMWLNATTYPETDKRAGLAELQWVQYQLDNCETVADVIATDAVLRISKNSAPIHFLVVDALGNVATFEYIEGKALVYTGTTLPVCALTNDTYQESLNYRSSTARNAEIFKPTSLDRFERLATRLESFNTAKPIDYSFDILKSVAQGNFTKWSIVYDIKNMTVYFTTTDNVARTTLRVNDFDFDCNTPVLWNPLRSAENDPKKFALYSTEKNYELIGSTFEVLVTVPEFLKFTPSKEEQYVVSQYPAKMSCVRNRANDLKKHITFDDSNQK